ncbi:hypothetical protein CMQ_339 [Grosmannia clavigera kw1407]|uniref:Protein kinase domain-containing protein n=1 Tax=Grosmannia clavigera (strain kw1407 / UAMH 11150) TaxID=655863 RepID=F0XRG8_GROCL|nr:uncharacterized protein CMQ_339 [Grosmannia clavigera kw1407]EFX00022.1 hypothetical protein CMQ_339 [Grosmannia clavigera kw1407]
MVQNADKVRCALFTVEYKAGHKLMPEALMATLDGRLSDQVLFADAAEAARLTEEKRQRSRLGDAASAEEEGAESTVDITTEQENNETSPSPSLKTARNRTAQILTQAFHYMKEIHLPELQEEDVVDHGSIQHSAATARQTPVALVLTLILLALQKTAPQRHQARAKQQVLIPPSKGPDKGVDKAVAASKLTPRAYHNNHTARKSACLLSAVKEQLTRNLDDGCAALDGHGKFGAIGALFRVTAYPQGYTFVAKGVQDDDRESLDLENRVYQQLAVLQGSVVPVCLGLVDLRRAYVLTGGARVLRLMLLSYAGERAQPEQVSEEVERELEGTLRTHGVEHGDLRLANVLWSEELCRLMVVDFDRATLHTKRKRGVEKELQQDKKSNTAWAKVG